MKLIDKRFWAIWLLFLLLAIVCCIAEGWSDDTVLLDAAYAMSLVTTWLCHRVRPRVAYGNLIVMIVYNAILAYNLVFNSQYGSGMAWWFYALLLNTAHSIALLLFVIINVIKRKKTGNAR